MRAPPAAPAGGPGAPVGRRPRARRRALPAPWARPGSVGEGIADVRLGTGADAATSGPVSAAASGAGCSTEETRTSPDPRVYGVPSPSRRPSATRSRSPVTPGTCRSTQVEPSSPEIVTGPSAVVSSASPAPRITSFTSPPVSLTRTKPRSSRSPPLTRASSTSSKPAPSSTRSQTPATRALAVGGSSTTTSSPSTAYHSPGTTERLTVTAGPPASRAATPARSRESWCDR